MTGLARPIGVFDSGVGGLTVVRSLRRILPNENIVYFGDTARVPYGSKSAAVVREYALQDTEVLLRHDPKAIVVACNTVSAVGLDVVQKKAQIPVLGVIHPGAEGASAATKTGRIGIIGTQGTIHSRAYEHALRNLDDTLRTFASACPLFVPLIEEGWEGHPVTHAVAKEYLHPLLQQKIDTLILACTHYPLLKPTLQSVCPGVRLIDSGDETGQAVRSMLTERALLNPSTLAPQLQFLVSDIPLKFSEIGARFLGHTLGRVRLVPGIPH
jgi:glutamate racemase